MATSPSYRAEGAKPRQLTATVKFTGAADVDADGFTVTENPQNIVDSVTKSAEGVILVTFRQKWASLDNLVLSTDLDDYTFTWDANAIGSSPPTATITCRKQSDAASASTDLDDSSNALTLFLRYQ